MKDTLQTIILNALGNLGIQAESVVLEHPADLAHGDYSTSAALAYAKAAQKAPRALAEEIVSAISSNMPKEIASIEIAGPGFINFKLSKEFFATVTNSITANPEAWGTTTLLSGKKVMVEYTQPNPFKPFHIGHLMSNAIGESLSRIVEACGAKTVRANYQGDVGPHVAKAIWMMQKKGIAEAQTLPANLAAAWIGTCYSDASTLYEENPEIKAEIDAINKQVYDRSNTEVNELYDWGRKVSLEAFEGIYATLGTRFDHYFFESAMAPIGKEIVLANIGKVFEESNGAIVFQAQNHDPKLHTRVFINSQGLPTYETKEIGLTLTKFEKENPDISIVTTAIEQGEYMKVVQKAISLMYPEYESRMKHVTHGMMRFASGKMSSRKGNVITGESLITDAKEIVFEKMAERDFTAQEREAIATAVGVSAVKYSILRQATGGDILFDFEKSISFEGDSGPYLQYTAIRASAVLQKALAEGIAVSTETPTAWQETHLEKYLYRFDEVIAHSFTELQPHYITTYLTELASYFNTFYSSGKIVDSADPASGYRLALTQAFFITMKRGLYLLGITLPTKM